MLLPAFSGQLSSGDKDRLDGVSFAKLLNEDCVQMYFILMTSRVMLIPNYFARRQTKDTLCSHCCPNKDPKNCCSPSEVVDTVTHCHILNFH